MRTAWHSVLVLAIVFSISSCSGTGAQSQALKTLDSLSGAVNATVKEFEKIDTLMLQKAVARFVHYRQFIRQNINDTIAKSDADNLQHFYNSGENLEYFKDNRESFLAQARLVNSQLKKLAEDVKNKALGEEQASQFIEQEKAGADNLCETGSFQKRSFYADLEEFKSSLRGVEQLIRSHNSGELPTIVKDTLAF